ncbi:uncharacterized protein LOC128549572 isoform X2 [Mercenaria mercenaria]|uniref:uncharacterized protein LOC128549572 isoform X2 n=1 Tax=Mercenaria mercenaria TaxID=6596 RepID=UPI00234F0F2F|nr:uncharacterized protein LOC128549572 isoform X2 [Mercenaria mercenaria]
MADEKDILRKSIGKLSLPKKSEDSADLAQIDANLSPTTQENLGVLLRSISDGEARIDKDSDGRAQIKYKAVKKFYWDASNANRIAQPKSDSDIQDKVNACLEIIDYVKSEKPPSGVALDTTKISISSEKEYRLDYEFEKTKEILGRGTSGDVVVVKDRTTGHEHAYKTMMISCFREEEVRCWVHMSNTGCVPSLYLFKFENNKVAIHMEILENAKTLSSIIEEHMARFYESETTKSLVKPFSLYVLDGALEAIIQMHYRGDNVMVQKTASDKLRVKILDFGLAKKLEDQNGLNLQGIKKDITRVMRLFSDLYIGGLEFQIGESFEQTWNRERENVKDKIKMSVDDREELFCLLDAAVEVVNPAHVREYKNLVKNKFDSAKGDEKNFMKTIVAFLFPEKFELVHQHAETDYADVTDQRGDMTDIDLEQTANQVSNEDLDLVRMTLGISLR